MNKTFKQYLSEAPLKLVDYQEKGDEKDNDTKEQPKEVEQETTTSTFMTVSLLSFLPSGLTHKTVVLIQPGS